jgi:hypothetical protein
VGPPAAAGGTPAAGVRAPFARRVPPTPMDGADRLLALLAIAAATAMPEPHVARVLLGRRGMNTTPSLWLLTGMVLGGLTVAGLALVRTLQHARVLP